MDFCKGLFRSSSNPGGAKALRKRIADAELALDALDASSANESRSGSSMSRPSTSFGSGLSDAAPPTDDSFDCANMALDGEPVSVVLSLIRDRLQRFASLSSIIRSRWLTWLCIALRRTCTSTTNHDQMQCHRHSRNPRLYRAANNSTGGYFTWN